MNTFADTVRLARQEAGLTQVQLAERAGITQSYLSHIEVGTRTTSVASARAICSALKLGPPWPAVAFLEAYAAKQQDDFGIAPRDTFAELTEAVSGGGYLVFEADAVDEDAA